MDRVTITSTADTTSSLSYETTVTLAQESPVGSVCICNDGLFQSAGSWSLFADPPVAIFLTAWWTRGAEANLT